MAKNNISIPGKFPFSVSLPVRITDMNYGGHLGNDSFLTIAHEARVRFLEWLGYTELNFAGPGLILANVAIDYKAEIKYGDILVVDMAVSEIGKVQFDIVYQFYGERKSNKFLAANIRTGMVVYNYQLKKVQQIPPAAEMKLKSIL